MPDVAIKNGSPIVINGVIATNCDCCSCYYLKPASCCDGAPGPVRYRVYGTHTLLDTFATSGDPLYIVLRPDGFELGAGLDYSTASGGTVAILEAGAVPTCWLVETSTDCDEGEILTWIEFDGEPLDDPSGGEYDIGNIAEATVLYDPEYFPAPDPCEDADPDNCAVICDGVCYSLSATVEFHLQCTLNIIDSLGDPSGTSSVDITDGGDMFHQIGASKCDETAWGGVGNPTILGTGCDEAFAYRDLVTPGPTRNVGVSFAADNTPTITDSLWNSATGETVTSVTGITITRTFTSAVNWVNVGGVCYVEVAP